MKVEFKIYKFIKDSGINFIASIPSIYLKNLLNVIEAKNEIIYLPVTREEEGIGIAAGAYLGGKKPAVLMQYTGLGNSINTIISLLQLYDIPIIFFITPHGGDDEPINSLIPMGYTIETLLDDISIRYWIIKNNKELNKIKSAINFSNQNKKSVMIILKSNVWSE
jgi:sulfopyruvate decarboxylase subunit alpha